MASCPCGRKTTDMVQGGHFSLKANPGNQLILPWMPFSRVPFSENVPFSEKEARPLLVIRPLSGHQAAGVGFERVAIGDGIVGSSVEATEPVRQRATLFAAANADVLQRRQVGHQAAGANDRDQERLPFRLFTGLCNVVAGEPVIIAPLSEDLLGHRVGSLATG